MRNGLVALTTLALAVLAALPAQAQTAGKPKGVPWSPGTPELPKPRKKGVVAEGPVEGPTQPQIRELAPPLRKGFGVILFWWWPGADGPGKACQEMDKEFWATPELLEAITKGEYVCIKVNAKKCPKELFKQYKVGKFPTIQVYTCDAKLAKSWAGLSKNGKAAAKTLLGIAKRNDALRKKREAQRKKMEKEFERIEKLKAAGKLDDARKAFEDVIKKHPDTEWAEDARWGIKEIKMIGIAAEGETLFKAKKYAEAKGRLSVVADFEIPCPARDTARKLLPECEVGMKIEEAEKLAADGQMLKAIEILQKIVADEWYDGPMKKTAGEKIVELKEKWGK